MIATDRYWKVFWLGWGSIIIIGLTVACSLFVYYTRQGDLLAAVGVSFDPARDPFEGTILGQKATVFSLIGGYLYQNSLPLHFKPWTWSAIADWRNTEQIKAGTYALKAQFLEPGGTVGMSGFEVVLKDLKSISLSVRADEAVNDVYLILYDKNGVSLGEQSLGWYATRPEGTTTAYGLRPNTWEDVVVPLANFGLTDASSSISGFSVSSKSPGVAYIDEVQLTKTDVQRDRWVPPPEPKGEAFNPFATSTPTALPYVFTTTPENLAKWYSYFGSFGPGKSGQIEMGPSPEATSTGSMTIFRGGVNWSDYRIEANLDWGEVSVFSLLARFVNDGDFASCAFSRYGEGVQLYSVKKGSSTFIAQTPPLPVNDYEPWIGVKVGMAVQGKEVSCYVNGEEVLKSKIDDMQPQGSVGLETWDPNPRAAQHHLNSYTVTPIGSE
jgi:hypothetical protein